MLDQLSNQLDSYLTLVSQRQKLVASNIANADTPGYKTKDIDFEAQLNAALQTGGANPSPPAVTVPGLRVKNDGNNVDLDREARLLAENALRFGLASTLMKGQFAQIKEAIKEGGS